MDICFQFSVDIPRSGVAELSGNPIFNLLRNCKTFPKQLSFPSCIYAPISPYPCQHLLLSIFLITDSSFLK